VDKDLRLGAVDRIGRKGGTVFLGLKTHRNRHPGSERRDGYGRLRVHRMRARGLRTTPCYVIHRNAFAYDKPLRTRNIYRLDIFLVSSIRLYGQTVQSFDGTPLRHPGQSCPVALARGRSGSAGVDPFPGPGSDCVADLDRDVFAVPAPIALLTRDPPYIPVPRSGKR
jgi:hypothetical protein